jgi:TetR/AcrR family transcriptional repressor of nem operon
MSKGTETRNRIIAKAAPLFNRKGFEGCSMQNIVGAVGLEKGSLYGHFPNKEALAIAAFQHAWKETSSARLAELDTVASAIEKLKLHVNHLVSLPQFPGGCPLINTIVDSDDGNPALKKVVRDALKQWRVYLQNLVAEGKARKEIRTGVEPEDVAALLISLFEGAMVLDRLDRKSGFLDKAGKHMNSYLDTLSYQ